MLCVWRGGRGPAGTHPQITWARVIVADYRPGWRASCIVPMDHPLSSFRGADSSKSSGEEVIDGLGVLLWRNREGAPVVSGKGFSWGREW